MGKQYDDENPKNNFASLLHIFEKKLWVGCGPSTTPPKFNMEPENQPLEKEIPIGNHHFQVPC